MSYVWQQMNEFILPVIYNGEELELPVNMYPYGYTFRVEVLIWSGITDGAESWPVARVCNP